MDADGVECESVDDVSVSKEAVGLKRAARPRCILLLEERLCTSKWSDMTTLCFFLGVRKE